MNDIYILNAGHYPEEAFLDNYATDEEGIKRLVLKAYSDAGNIVVDMRKGFVTFRLDGDLRRCFIWIISAI